LKLSESDIFLPNSLKEAAWQQAATEQQPGGREIIATTLKLSDRTDTFFQTAAAGNPNGAGQHL